MMPTVRNGVCKLVIKPWCYYVPQEVHWQGPYTVTKVFDDGLKYELDTGKTRKQHRIYHINLLSKWQTRDELAALVMQE